MKWKSKKENININLNRTSLKYPCAFDNVTNKIVEISQVTKENKANLICPICKEGFVAVINHPTQHFRHKPNTICTGNSETFLHWVVKEIFKDINEFEIPEIYIDDLPENKRQIFQKKKSEILDANIPDSFYSEFKKGLKSFLFNSKKVLINKIKTEEEFETKFGDVVIDIVAYNEDEKIFIEPFFSNPIDKEKKKKLSLINIPTLSINLKSFLESNGEFYIINSLKKYLISKESKTWSNLIDEECDKYIENYENYLIEEIERNKDLIEIHNSKLKKISNLNLVIEKRKKDVSIIMGKISELEREIKDLEIELDINH